MDDFKKPIVVCLAVNGALFTIKFFVSIVSDSAAIFSEALNSFSDLIYTAILLFGLHIAMKAPDEDHPYGHRRIEPLISLLISVSIFYVGYQAVSRSISQIKTPETVIGYTPIIVLLVSIFVKFLISFYLESEGKRHGMPALLATAKDCKSDSLASLSALIGVVGNKLGYLVLDPVAGILVSLWIFATGISIVRENIGYLIGKAPPESVITTIEEKIKQTPNVRDPHDIKAHYVGPKLHVSVHVYVPKDKSFEEIHRLEERIAKKIEEMDEVDTAFVHVDPVSE